MSQFLTYAIPGIPYGCVFALMAVGLVLTYKASGVFNLAFGAQAYMSALVFSVALQHGWPKWAAALLAIFVLGPLVGLALERMLFRFTRSAPPLVKLVSALGILIAIPSLCQIFFGTSNRYSAPSLFLQANKVYLHVGTFAVDGIELATTVATAVVVIGLALLFRSGGLGLRMRAVVESPRMAQLAGVNADRTSAFAWGLSSAFAGLAGVLLAPLYAQLNVSNFSDLLVAAIAAAAVGGFSSLPLTLLGGLFLGIGQEVLGGYLPSGSVLSGGLRPAFPFVVLVILLVVVPRFRRRPEAIDPLRACDPPTASLTPTARMSEVAIGTKTFTGLVVVVLTISALTWMPGNWLFTLTEGMVLSVIFLSITLLTGMGGQISLCQATFAGVGAFTAGQLAQHFDTSVLVGMLAGGLLAAVIGVLVALPTIRLGGITLALTTLAFALLADNILFPYSWVGNGVEGLSLPRPIVGSISFAGGGAFFWLVLVVLLLMAGMVTMVRLGTTGRELAAIRGSEVAAQSIGIDVRRLRVVVFALSAGIAGVGGVLYGSLQQTVSPNDFAYEFSLVYIVVVAVVGIHTVSGAIEAGILYTALQQLISDLPSRYGTLLAVLFGLAALTYVRHPEGAGAYAKRWVLDRAEQLARHLDGSSGPRVLPERVGEA